jgi:hypothetical protein
MTMTMMMMTMMVVVVMVVVMILFWHLASVSAAIGTTLLITRTVNVSSTSLHTTSKVDWSWTNARFLSTSGYSDCCRNRCCIAALFVQPVTTVVVSITDQLSFDAEMEAALETIGVDKDAWRRSINYRGSH